jgi:hypothetical protein
MPHPFLDWFDLDQLDEAARDELCDDREMIVDLGPTSPTRLLHLVAAASVITHPE